MKIFILLFLFKSIFSFGDIELRYSATSNTEEKNIKKWIEDSKVFESSVNLVNSEIKIGERVLVLVGGEDFTHYNPETKQVVISYSFIGEVMDRFKEEYTNEWNIYTADALEHTFYHELGHALVDILDIPVLGKEEDAVDDFGVIMLIITREDGRDMALSASELFFMEGEDIDEFTPEDFMDEHSLDDQRGYRALSLIYGSNPDEYEDIADELNMDDERRDISIEMYEQQTLNWLILLEPHLKDGILLETLEGY